MIQQHVIPSATRSGDKASMPALTSAVATLKAVSSLPAALHTCLNRPALHRLPRDVTCCVYWLSCVHKTARWIYRTKSCPHPPLICICIRPWARSTTRATTRRKPLSQETSDWRPWSSKSHSVVQSTEQDTSLSILLHFSRLSSLSNSTIGTGCVKYATMRRRYVPQTCGPSRPTKISSSSTRAHAILSIEAMSVVMWCDVMSAKPMMPPTFLGELWGVMVRYEEQLAGWEGGRGMEVNGMVWVKGVTFGCVDIAINTFRVWALFCSMHSDPYYTTCREKHEPATAC